MKDLFEYTDYKAYLNERLDDDPILGGRGVRARLSEAASCKTSYTAQVLRGHAHFTPEQGEGINQFLNHSDDEGQFFLLLLQLARAGTPALRARLSKLLQGLKKTRLVLKNRLKVDLVLHEQAALIYYSAWYYSAIHAIVSIPEFQSVETISRFLRLPQKTVAEVLDFLVSTGILIKSAGVRGYKTGTAKIHLGSDSPLISKHHTNWRVQAIRSLEVQREEDLHYSSVVSISHDDSTRIREILVKTIERIRSIIDASKEEKIQSFSLDFFGF